MTVGKSKTRFHAIMIPMAVFLLIGFVFTVVGIGFAISDAAFRKHAVETSATILEIEPNVLVEYTTEKLGVIQTQIDQYSSSMKVGSQIPILYSLEDPYDARSPEVIRILTMAFCLIGLCFLWIGAAAAVFLLIKRRQAKYLRENGYRISVRVEKAVMDKMVRVNRRHPYTLIGTARVDGITRQFRYYGFFEDPQAQIGSYLTVYYDPLDPAKYTADAPEEAKKT